MWTLKQNSSKHHSRSKNSGEKFRTGDEENLMAYCGKCICLCSKTTPSKHYTYWKSFWIVNWATSIQECRIILRYGNLKPFRFSARHQVPQKLDQSKCVHLTDLHSKMPSRIVNNLLHRKLCNTTVFLLVKFIFSCLRGLIIPDNRLQNAHNYGFQSYLFRSGTSYWSGCVYLGLGWLHGITSCLDSILQWMAAMQSWGILW